MAVVHFGNAARGGPVCPKCKRYCIEHACKRCSSYTCKHFEPSSRCDAYRIGAAPHFLCTDEDPKICRRFGLGEACACKACHP